MIRKPEQDETSMDTARAVLAAIALLLVLSAIFNSREAHAEAFPDFLFGDTPYIDNSYMFEVDDEDIEIHSIILEDPMYIMPEEEEEELAWLVPEIPTITSVGRKNVKVNGVKSRYSLIAYTIPEQLLIDDPDFLSLMIEAEKYIGYPYVYGASNPDTGFDCSGFVSWVFIHSGVYNTGRKGANGLHKLCREVDESEVRPGDLVFFEGTMGPDVDGITHVGIYVGNHMMIHAGDPVGFADLRSERWQKKIVCFGRLPID